jgi:hypothetical protein
MPKPGNPKKREDILQRDLDDGCVLQVPEQPQVFTLNITAALVWELCDGKHSPDRIADEIVASCEKTRAEVIDDVRAIVRDFREKNLLQSTVE